ncbi:hypothetical protein [Leptolyngbya sp. NIES-2104]|uniref:hypothetical protein n=1 Tax=Leptolyngbya sp. NIES-2104 TaxID=1552121 RepID=UPI00073ED656|nr:hypothetical protein [Leptolyngbya sp. NIES-2104]
MNIDPSRLEPRKSLSYSYSAYSGDLLADVPLLRLRIQVGDAAPVLTDCFLALLLSKYFGILYFYPAAQHP